jgi:tetratricopeptide (TPR) repeat protein
MRLSLFYISFFLIPLCAFSQENKLCDSLFVASLRAYDQQDYALSLQLVYANIEKCTPHENYHLHAAKCYHEQKNVSKIILQLNNALAINDSCVDAYAFLGQVYLEEHFYMRAIEQYEKIFQLLPLDSLFHETYHLNLSKAYNYTQQYQKTYTLLKKVESQATKNVGFHANIAVSCMHLNKLEEAEHHVRRCVEIDPYFTGGLVNMGYFYLSVGEFEKSIDFFNRALAINQREAYALNNRGFAFFNMKDYERALQDIKSSIAIAPDNSYAYKNLGLVFLNTGLTQEACLEFERALRLGFTEMYGNEVLELQQSHCVLDKKKK